MSGSAPLDRLAPAGAPVPTRTLTRAGTGAPADDGKPLA
ncbi:hypothetical protein EDD98_6451 [Streptomyces sp. PanSC19]|nr:hypothetical protein EDD98_6451 [Streptomyces sp. PanSC19]